LYDGRRAHPAFFGALWRRRTAPDAFALSLGERPPRDALARGEAIDGGHGDCTSATTVGSRALDQRRELGAELVFEPQANFARQRRTAAAGGDGDLELPAAKHRGHDEVAVVASVDDVHQDAAATRQRGRRPIDARVSRRGDHQHAASQIRPTERARPTFELAALGERGQLRRERQAHHGHVSTALEQRSSLALADLAAPDDEAVSAAEIEEGREIVGHGYADT